MPIGTLVLGVANLGQLVSNWLTSFIPGIALKGEGSKLMALHWLIGLWLAPVCSSSSSAPCTSAPALSTGL